MQAGRAAAFLCRCSGPTATRSVRPAGTSSGATGGLGEGEHLFSLALACPEHGHSMDELQPRDFSFNAPYGACPDCLGIGSRDEVDPSLVVPDPSLIAERGRHRAVQERQLLPPGAARRGPACGHRRRHPVGGHAQEGPEGALARPRQREGTRGLPHRGRPRHLLVHRVGGRARRGEAPLYRRPSPTPSARSCRPTSPRCPCQTCGGKRLKPEVLAVTVNDKSIHDVTEMSAAESLRVLRGAALHGPGGGHRRAHREGDPQARLRFLVDVGLDYLTLERATATLSGGEAQRIRLGHPDRRRAHGRALHSGRALHRAAPARQRAAHRHAGAPARPGQHRGGRGARRGHHPGGRLRGGHGPGRRRARRPGRRGGDAGRGHGHRGLASRPTTCRGAAASRCRRRVASPGAAR